MGWRVRVVCFLALAAFVLPLALFASDVPEGAPRSVRQLYNVVCRLANWFFAIVLVIAVVTFLRGAVEFFLAGGNEQQISHAKQLFLYALLGTAVALLSRSLVIAIGGLLGVTVRFTGECS